jgi:hypothetical protein
MMNLHKEAAALAKEALDESREYGADASDMLHQMCDGHEVAIYYHKAIQFCADQDTSAGEEWLEDCGGIAQPGDSFGAIACRIAFATLYCAAQAALSELEAEAEDA